jgi:hypothetical protein
MSGLTSSVFTLVVKYSFTRLKHCSKMFGGILRTSRPSLFKQNSVYDRSIKTENDDDFLYKLIFYLSTGKIMIQGKGYGYQSLYSYRYSNDFQDYRPFYTGNVD